MKQLTLPILITFDGEARSGKGTIVSAVKDYLRDEMNKKVMLIDAGQVFRVLVVAALKAAVNLDNPKKIDEFLSDEVEAEKCVQLVKAVYHMEKLERDTLLYTNEVGVNSAKIGAREKSQKFKDVLLKKWLRDAGNEGVEIALLDGRALEETGTMLEKAELCKFKLGLYFTCDPLVGARRTLGFASTSYDSLSGSDKTAVDELGLQIVERNTKDRLRKVQPIVPPRDAEKIMLPMVPKQQHSDTRLMIHFDTTREMTIQEMTDPVTMFVAQILRQ